MDWAGSLRSSTGNRRFACTLKSISAACFMPETARSLAITRRAVMLPTATQHADDKRRASHLGKESTKVREVILLSRHHHCTITTNYQWLISIVMMDLPLLLTLHR
jgi:hypothetical protein